MTAGRSAGTEQGQGREDERVCRNCLREHCVCSCPCGCDWDPDRCTASSSVPPARDSGRDEAREQRWRTGRRVGRTIYAQPGPHPSDDDLLIGVMDTTYLARAAVDGHNALLRDGTTT